MIRSRVSIATLLVVVGLMAVGFAALRVSSRLWANASFSVVLLSLVVAIAALIYRQGPRRAFWAGFALFGWTYLILVFGPAPLNGWKDWLVTVPVLAMLEERLLIEAAPNATGRPPASSRVIPRAPQAAYAELTPWSYWTATDRSNPFSSDSFNRIGHSLFCFGIAMAGGAFCRFLRDTRDEPSSSP